MAALIEAREAAQRELANRLDRAHSFVGKIECRRVAVEWAGILRVCRRAGADAAEILRAGGEGRGEVDMVLCCALGESLRDLVRVVKEIGDGDVYRMTTCMCHAVERL